MPRVKLFLTIDVADFDGCLTAHERALLCARVLAACHQSADSLTWAYKLVNTSVPPRAFEAALHDACTSSLTGEIPLPFTPEEHVRCNCTMFEGLRRWLHELSQDTFHALLAKHLNKTGHKPSASHVPATWKVLEKHLQDLPLSWFEEVGTDDGSVENRSPNAPSLSAGIYRAAMLVSSAPQTFQQLADFLGASQDLDSSSRLLAMDSADVAECIANKVSPVIASKFQKAKVSLHWNATGRAVTTPRLSMEEILEGDRLRVERRHKKALQWVDGRISACSAETQTLEVQLDGEDAKSYELAELVQLQHKQKLQWVEPAETIAQSLTNMLQQCFCGGGMVNGAQLLNSKQQQGINAALNALLGSSTRPAMQEAFPGTECDMHSLVQQLDLRIAPEDAAKFKQLAEEALKLKQAKRHARKERRKAPPPKPVDEAAARLAEHRARVMKQERELHRAKADQQKAELDAKRRLLFRKEKAVKEKTPPTSCDPDEVMSQRRAEPAEEVAAVEEKVHIDPSISASRTISEAISVRNSFLQGDIPAEHEAALASISQFTQELVSAATTSLRRCSESAVCATESAAPIYRPCPSPSASRLACSPPASKALAASLLVVRQALEMALLQDNEDFWAENPPHPSAMDQQDPARRNKLAMQMFLRLHILVACQGDISVERLADPPIIIPTGAYWEGLEEYWSDLVNELPDIPNGGNDYFLNKLKPSLGAQLPKAIQMLGRNCGLYSEDDLLLNPEGDGGVVVGDSCCPAPSGSRLPASRASSLQPSVSRGSGGPAQPAVSDNSSGHGSGSTLPQPRTDHQAAKPKLGHLLAKPPVRKRDLTQRLGNGRQIKWNPKAAMIPKGKVGMAGKKKLQSKKTETPPTTRIRASDLAMSPTSTEDSDAIPGTGQKAHREATSVQPKASKRHLAFCPIPTIQELEAEEAKDDDAEFVFGDDADAETGAAEEQAAKPAAKGWLQNATRKVNLGRHASRQLSRGVSSLLPPPEALHPTQSTRLDKLITTLSPAKSLPVNITSPCKPRATHAKASPQAAHGIKSPHRFSPGPSRMSPHHAKQPSSMLSPDRPRRVQRSLLSPVQSKVVKNLLSPRHAKPIPTQQASVAAAHAASVDQKPEEQEQMRETQWGPRPGSATFSSTVACQASTSHQGGVTAHPDAGLANALCPPACPFASLAHQPHASDARLQQQQHDVPADFGPRPQSASFSSALPHAKPQQHAVAPAVVEAPVSALLQEPRLSSEPAALSLADGAALPPPALFIIDQTDQYGLAAAATVPADACNAGPSPGRPASAFAPVADQAPPADWQAATQVEQGLEDRLLEQPGNAQESYGAKRALPSLMDHKDQLRRQMRKLTKRKKTDPCMESQPLASADAELAHSPEQQDSMVEAWATGQLGQDGAAQGMEMQLVVADASGQDVQATPGHTCLDEATARVTDAGGKGSQDESLAVVPASDDEAEATELVHELTCSFSVWQRIAKPSDSHPLPETVAVAAASDATNSEEAAEPLDQQPSCTLHVAAGEQQIASEQPDRTGTTAPDARQSSAIVANPVAAPTADSAAVKQSIAAASPRHRAPSANGSYRKTYRRKPQKSLPPDEAPEPVAPSTEAKAVTRAAAREAEAQAGPVLRSSKVATARHVTAAKSSAQCTNRAARAAARSQQAVIPLAAAAQQGQAASDQHGAVSPSQQAVGGRPGSLGRPKQAAADAKLEAANTKSSPQEAVEATAAPEASAAEPKAATASHEADTAAPRADTAAPGADTAAPGADTAAPGAATAEPDNATTEPGAATTDPKAPTAEPDAATAEPDVTTTEAVIADAQPVCAAERPRTRAQTAHTGNEATAEPEAGTAEPDAVNAVAQPVRSAANSRIRPPAGLTANNVIQSAEAGCSKCRWTGCKVCRAKLQAAKESAADVASDATNWQHGSPGVLQCTEQAATPSREPTAAAQPIAGALARATRAANRANARAERNSPLANPDKPASVRSNKRQREEESDGEQLPVRPMPVRPQHRSSQVAHPTQQADSHTASAAQPAGPLPAHLPSDRASPADSASEPAQVATSEEALVADGAPCKARIPKATEPAAAQCAASPATGGAAAADTATAVAEDALARAAVDEAAVPAAPDTARRSGSGRCRKPTQKAVELDGKFAAFKLKESHLQSDDADQDPSYQHTAAACSPSGRGIKRAASQAMSADASRASAPSASKSVAKRRRKQPIGPALHTISESIQKDSQRAHDADVETLTKVYTDSHTAMNLGGSLREEPRRKTPASRGKKKACAAACATADEPNWGLGASAEQSQSAAAHSLDILVEAAQAVQADLRPEAAEHAERRTSARLASSGSRTAGPWWETSAGIPRPVKGSK